MGHIISRIEDIDRLSFHPFPARPLKHLVGVVRVEGTLVAVDKRGKIYTTASVSKNYAYAPGKLSFGHSLFMALVKLGVITQSAVDQHEAYIANVERRRAAKHALDHYAKELHKLGVPLTKAQIHALKKMAA